MYAKLWPVREQLCQLIFVKFSMRYSTMMSTIVMMLTQHQSLCVVSVVVDVRLGPFSLVALFDVGDRVPDVAVAAVDVPFAVVAAAFRLALAALALRFPSVRVSHIYHIDRDQRQA